MKKVVSTFYTWNRSRIWNQSPEQEASATENGLASTLWTEKYLCQILVHPQQPAATWSPTAAPSGAHASKPVLTMVNTI